MQITKTILIVLFVTVLAGIGYWMINPPQRVAAIEIPVDAYDFGDVLYGDIPSHEFEVKNNGQEDLVIKKISTSCGCTTAEISTEVIQPKESATLTVYFNPAIHKDDTDLGELTRVVYISSNDPENSETEVTIHANVYKELN